MPCGMNMDDLVARMKASGVPGSTEAENILEQMLTADTPEHAEAEGLQKIAEPEGPQETAQETGSPRITT